MGVNSCTGPMCEAGVLDYNAGWGLDVWGAHWELQYHHSKSIDSQVSVFTEALALEEYKHSASVQSLLLLLRLVERRQEHKVIEQVGSSHSWSGMPPSSLKNAQLQLLPWSLQVGSWEFIYAEYWNTLSWNTQQGEGTTHTGTCRHYCRCTSCTRKRLTHWLTQLRNSTM